MTVAVHESVRRDGSPAALPIDTRDALAVPVRDRPAAVALAQVDGVGPVRWRALMRAAGGDGVRAAASHGVSDRAWRDALRTASQWLDETNDRERVLLVGDPDYPTPLLDLVDAPPVLWVRGDAEALHRPPMVAFVGTRHNTGAGAHVVRRLIAALADLGPAVVSGMARGIDGIAHDAALVNGLTTIAVLGTGVDVPYPAQHRALYHRICDTGAVVSERPPGTPATPGAFPRRNRIIAALAQCTVVVEAGERSGALITADAAAELGRTVAAVPGAFDSTTAAGTNALLRDGAHVLASVDDLRMLVGASVVDNPASPRAPRQRDVAPHRPPSARQRPRVRMSIDAFTADERLLWDVLVEPAPDADTAAWRAGLDARRCAAALAGLELHGAILTELSGELRRV